MATHDSLRFRFKRGLIPDYEFQMSRIPDSGFQKGRIPDSGYQKDWISDSGFLELNSGFQKAWILDSEFLELDSGFQKAWIQDSRFLDLDSGFQKGLIPHFGFLEQISWIPESGWPYKGRSYLCINIIKAVFRIYLRISSGWWNIIRYNSPHSSKISSTLPLDAQTTECTTNVFLDSNSRIPLSPLFMLSASSHV